MRKNTLLITAGPTREYIDPVRFISNLSSGKLGYEIAEEFSKHNYNVILISGPTNLKVSKKINLYNVETADEMFKYVRKYFPICDVFISVAAVCDFKPVKVSKQKIKKKKEYIIKLVPTVDILKYCGTIKKNRQILVGFALETDKRKALLYAEEKLKEKNLDLIILNSPDTFANDFIKPKFIYKDSKIENYKCLTKKRFAKILYKIVTKLLNRAHE